MLPPKVLVLILIQFIVQPCFSERIIHPLNGQMFAKLNKNYSLICHWGPGSSVRWEDSDGNSIDIRFRCRSSGTRTTKIFPDAVTSCDHIARTSTLQIRNVTKDYNGMKIKCLANNKQEEFQIKISDKRDLSHYIILSLSKKEIYDGQDVEVRCHWNPKNQDIPTNLTCGKKQKIQNGSVVLKLTMTKEWHKKYCKCEAFHFGTRIVTSHQIIVYFAPQVYVHNSTVVAGEMAVLNCLATRGYPDTYSYLGWHHFFKNVLLEKRSGFENGSLVIPNATWQDEGIWICSASNGEYNQSNSAYLTINGPPFLTALNRNVEVVSGSNKKLEVQMFPFYNNIKITWKHNGRKISKGTPRKLSSAWQQRIKGHEVYLSGLTVSLTLNDVQEKDAGNYSVSVVTRDGTSLYHIQMKISKPKMTLFTAGLICGTLIMILFITIFGCVYFCYRRKRYHPTIIDPAMSTLRTRTFSIPKNDSFDTPTSNFEMDIYEEIPDYNDNDKKKEDDYLNPAVTRYS